MANAELYFPSYLSDSIPGTEPNKAVIQNIMFVENKENGRFDPVIARYYPNNENSIREFGEIYYNMIELGWSGTIDIWTYDERHFIGFNILEGELVSTVRYDTGIDENAKVINGHNYLTVDCFRVPTTVSYTYTTTGYYETTVVATQNYATICSNGGSAASGYGNDSSITYPYLGPSDGGGSGSYGSVGEPSYTPPTVSTPGVNLPKISVLVQNKCIREQALKTVNSDFKNKITNLVLEIYEDSEDFHLFIEDFDFNDISLDGEASFSGPEDLSSATCTVVINSTLSQSSEEYIMATIFHELLHAYLGYLDILDPNSNNNEHEIMATEYMNMLKTALTEHFSISPTDAEHLSWGGLQFTNAYKKLNNKSQIEQTNFYYKNGTKGNKCEDL